jgi:hypothetical protein
MERVRKVRYRLPKNERAVFDVEIEPEYIHHNIEDKIKQSGLSVKQYEEALETIKRKPTIRLMILYGLIENDLLSNSYRDLNQALEWAKAKKDYKAVLANHKEKMLVIILGVASSQLTNSDE